MKKIDAVLISKFVALLIGGYYAVAFDANFPLPLANAVAFDANFPLPLANLFYLAPGFVFGCVVLIWQIKSFRELPNLRSLAFLIAATLTFFLVFRVIDIYDFRNLPGSVAMGTVILGLAHVVLLGATWRRLFIAIPGVLAIWYLGLLLINYGGIAIWQGAYLLMMFAPFPKWPAPAHRESHV